VVRLRANFVYFFLGFQHSEAARHARLLYRMTVHTKWMELLCKGACEAFHYREIGARVDANIIDDMPRAKASA
jgi:hypothetical protein